MIGAILAGGVILFAAIDCITTILGSLGLLNNRLALAAACGIAIVGLAAIARWIRTHDLDARDGDREEAAVEATPRSGAEAPPRSLAMRLSVLGLGVVVAAAVVLLFSRWGQPPSSWDALTYHLTHPIHWLESGTLETLHQTFGDPASAYYPIAAESFYAWAFLATGSDWWTPLAQLPAAVLGSLALFGIARWLGASSAQGIATAALWISTPVLLRQVGEAENDLWNASWLVMATLFALRFRIRLRPWDGMLFCAAFGLALGTKFLSVVFVPVLLILVFLGAKRSATPPVPGRFVGLGIGLMILLGGFAYLRNAWTCGNPLAPMRLAIAGHTILPGIVDATSFFGSRERNLEYSELLVSVRALADGGASFFAGAVGLLLAMSVLFRRGGSTVAGDAGVRLSSVERRVAFAAVVATVVFLVMVPNRQHRMAAFPLALALPFFVRRVPAPIVLGAILVNVAGGLLYLGKDVVLGTSTFEWSSWSTALAAAVLGVAALGWAAARGHLSRTRSIIAGALLGAILFVTTSWLAPEYEERRFDSWKKKWAGMRARAERFDVQTDRADWAECWSRSAEQTRERRRVVAFAGTNIPYPLRGIELRNEVLAIPPTVGGDDPYFDWGRALFDPSAPTDPEAWLSRLEKERVETLCVFRGAGESWPPELEWALGSPEFFEPIWRAEHAALFAVRNR